MADKKDKKEAKIVLERVYNVPLRRKYRRAPNWKRTKRAVTALREFAMKHMKAKEVKIGKYANLYLWKHGIKNPPHHIKINCKKDEDGIVRIEIVGAPEEKSTEVPKKKAKKEKEAEIEVKDALSGDEEKVEELKEKEQEAKEEKADKAKEIEKEGIDELKREHPKIHAPKTSHHETRVDIKKTQSAPERKR